MSIKTSYAQYRTSCEEFDLECLRSYVNDGPMGLSYADFRIAFYKGVMAEIASTPMSDVLLQTLILTHTLDVINGTRIKRAKTRIFN